MEPEFRTTWRCAPAENRRGAFVVVLTGDGDAETARCLLDLVPSDAHAVAIALPAFGCARAVARDLGAWLERRVGDAEESWLLGYGAGASAGAALLFAAPDRFSGASLLNGPVADIEPAVRLDGLPLFYGYRTVECAAAGFIARSSEILRRSGAQLTERAYASPLPLPLDEQRDLAVWFTVQFAEESRPSLPAS